MAERVALTIAGLLILLTMCVHSLVGHRRLIRPLLDQCEGVMQQPLARFIIPFAWHLTSFVGLVVAVILFAWAWVPGSERAIGLMTAGSVFTIAGVWDAIGSRRKHVGWVPLTLIGLACLSALFVR